MTCFRRESYHCSRLSLARKFFAHANDTHLFVALYNRWIEEAVGLEMTVGFSRQASYSPVSRTDEADHCSTALFDKCAWLRFAFSHCTYKHVVCIELRHSAGVLFTTTRLCGELGPPLATHKGHQSLNGPCVVLCTILAASVGGSGVRNARAALVSPDTSSCPACSASAIARLSQSEASRASSISSPSAAWISSSASIDTFSPIITIALR